MVCFLENFMGQRYEKKREMFFQGSTPANPFVVWKLFSIVVVPGPALTWDVFSHDPLLKNVAIFDGARTMTGTALLV